MTDFYQAQALLVETQQAMRRADELIAKICDKGHPSNLIDLIEPTLRLKERLAEELEQLEEMARERRL